MKKLILITSLILGTICSAAAQGSSYTLVQATIVSSDIVRLQINVFCKDKQRIECTAKSKFKRSDNKSTLYEVDVKILLLRKDLEKNQIKRQMGY